MADDANTTPTKEKTTFVPGSMLGKYHCRLLIGKYQRPSPFNNAEWNPHSNILLPLPDILNDQTAVKYNGIEMGAVGDAINNGITGAGNTLGTMGFRGVGGASSTAISNIAGSTAGALAEALSSSGIGDIVGGAVASAARDAFSADRMQTAFEQSLGAAPNPNPSVAFQGPQLREFGFTWTFFPTSEDESNRIFNIIKLLKRSSLPRNSLSNSASILEYPDMVQMNFFPWDTNGTGPWFWDEKNSIIRMKKCVMNSVTVNYNPSNTNGFFKNGSPVGIQLSISFSEIEYMLSSDWGDKTEGTEILNVVGNIALIAGAAGAFGIAGSVISDALKSGAVAL